MNGLTELPPGSPPEVGLLVQRVLYALWPNRIGTAHVIESSTYLPIGVRHLIGTEDSNGQSARTHEERVSRCFELAGWAIAAGVMSDKARLVHGSIHGPDQDMQRLGHAWIAVEDLVWEPIMACFYDKEAFYAAFSARDEVSYTGAQATNNIFVNQNFGCWHESRYPTKLAEEITDV